MNEKIDPAAIPFFINEELIITETKIQNTEHSKDEGGANEVTKEEITTPLMIFTDQELSSEEQAFLNKIIGSIGVDPTEAIITRESAPTSSNYSNAEKTIIFGTSLEHPKYVVTESVLYADAVRLIAVNVELKKKLWGAMKAGFLN